MLDRRRIIREFCNALSTLADEKKEIQVGGVSIVISFIRKPKSLMIVAEPSVNHSFLPQPLPSWRQAPIQVHP